MSEQDYCPCQSTELYAQCCQPYHIGDAVPASAVELMRSRYAAFVLRLQDYLVRTTHPAKTPTSLRSDLQATFATVQWTGLQILSTSQGGPADKMGKVKFEAKYTEAGVLRSMVEHSRFRRRAGIWYYFDGKG